MVKKILLFILIIICTASANACPICGCGVGNFFMGLLPGFGSKYVGIRYQYMHYHTQIAGDASQFGDDYYKTAELWGGFNIGKKWQVLAFIPYHFNVQKSDDGNTSENGLGDITLLANYNVWQSSKKNAAKKSITHQQLWLGGGFKLPVGKYKIDLASSESILADANSQIGSGSVDFLLNGAYNISFKKLGINNSVIYKINTSNNQQYQFGNRLVLNSIAFYKMQPKMASYAPNVGIMYENFSGNSFQKTTVADTKGYALTASGGIEIGYKKITIGSNVQLPLSQNFAGGQTQLKLKGMVHVSLTL